MNSPTGTWHYGLIARWWAEFNVAEPHELAFFRTAIQRFGEPVLDLGCGTGRILLPLLAEGFDVDGADVSPDMIAEARRLAEARGLEPRLAVQPMQELAPDRSYRTIYACGAFGIGTTPDQDRETLRRVHAALESGGAFLITDHELPRPGRQPRDWPERGERRRLADGDEIELVGRLAAVEGAPQRLTREIRARLWRNGELRTEESGRLTETDYSVAELEQMLREAGFDDLRVTANYTDRDPTADDEMVSLVARKRP
ncbi:MAG TPA: methyltransferase domain-containing protein [Candidatus Dormibacteraeota bacterium]|nr:methyltransferase domain-containing protein [Candidatus Dormibacteraeota bacterium]